MYCLSQFCCFCFRKNVKLKLLHKITCHDTTFLNIAIDVIPEIQLSGISHVVSICDDCVKYVTEMHTFRQTCIKNNHLLTEYVVQLGSASGDIGIAQVRISDLKMEFIKNIQVNDVNIELKDGTKTEEFEDESLPDFDFVSTCETSNPYYNETTVCKTEETEDIDYKSYDEERRDDVEIKIEVNDDFNDKYNYEEEEKKCFQQDELVDDKNESQESGQDRPKSKKKLCKICGKHVTTLNRHMLIHTGEKPCQCETCGKSFPSKHSLKRHNMIHIGDKPNKCEICGKSFFSKHTLRRHSIIHTGERPYRCETCGRSFGLRSTLISHERLHTGERPYKCELCGKCFSQKNNLSIHQMVHSEEKRYNCVTCGKSFFYLREMERHVLNHTGEKPYKCETCGKAYSLSSSLLRHCRMHFEEKPYKCGTCGKAFLRLYLLTKHEKLHDVERQLPSLKKEKTDENVRCPQLNQEWK